MNQFGPAHRPRQLYTHWGTALVPLFASLVACPATEPEPEPEPEPEGIQWADPVFDPIMVDSYQADLATIEIYEVPGMPCVRMESDIEGLPGNAVQPGGAPSFVIARPTDTDQPEAFVFLPHGNGIELLEATIVVPWNDNPSEDFLFVYNLQVATGADRDMTTAEYSRSAAEKTVNWDIAAALIGQGWGVVAPGNCWGDLGQGDGDRIIDGLYSAPRYGGLFDDAVIDMAAERWPDAQRLAWGCSGGGARTAARLHDDTTRFAAVVLDAPNDNYAGLLDAPLSSLVQQVIDLVGLDMVERLHQDFLNAFNGGRAGAEARSLGLTVGDSLDLNQVPIYMGWVREDGVNAAPLVEPLAQALSDPTRYDNPAGVVVEIPGTEHCVVSKDEVQRGAAVDWLVAQVAAGR